MGETLELDLSNLSQKQFAIFYLIVSFAQQMQMMATMRVETDTIMIVLILEAEPSSSHFENFYIPYWVSSVLQHCEEHCSEVITIPICEELGLVDCEEPKEQLW